MKQWLSLVIMLVSATMIYLFVYDYNVVQKELEEANSKLATKYGAFEKIVLDIPIHVEYSTHGGGYAMQTIENVRVTAYNNLPEQTNEQPNIGASNRKVYEGSIALSRDLLKTYNIRYGDKVCLLKTDKCYIVEDTMNKRYDDTQSKGSGRRADIFMYSKREALKVNFKTNMILLQQR